MECFERNDAEFSARGSLTSITCKKRCVKFCTRHNKTRGQRCRQNAHLFTTKYCINWWAFCGYRCSHSWRKMCRSRSHEYVTTYIKKRLKGNVSICDVTLLLLRFSSRTSSKRDRVSHLRNVYRSASRVTLIRIRITLICRRFVRSIKFTFPLLPSPKLTVDGK